MKTFLLTALALLCATAAFAQDGTKNDNVNTYVRFYNPANFSYNIIKVIDGVLYRASETGRPEILVRYPASKTDETFTVPETVRCIADRAIQGAKYLKGSSKN